MYYVYILKLNNNQYYQGYTNNLKRRLQQHKNGGNKSTSKYLPIKLVCYLAFENKKRAEDFEVYLKTGSGYAFRNRHLI